MPATLSVPRKVWTRDSAHALSDLGFPDASRLELVNGELIDHMGKKRPHVLFQHLILVWLQKTFGDGYVQSESPIDVADIDNRQSEPEPDLIVTARSIREYASRNPAGDDLRLVIEIADSTVAWDLEVKSILYARAGIADYWVVDIPGQQVHVHRSPGNSGYQEISKFGAAEVIHPLADLTASFSLQSLLG